MAYKFTARRRAALKRAAIISGRKRRSGASMKRDVVGKYRKRGVAGVPQRVRAHVTKARGEVRKVRAQSERAKARDLREAHWDRPVRKR